MERFDLIRIGITVIASALVWFRVWEPFAHVSLLGIAAVIQTHPEVGEAFSLLTAEPSPEVAVIHNRQIILPRPDQWLSWLDPSTPLPSASSWSTVSANRITEMGLET